MQHLATIGVGHALAQRSKSAADVAEIEVGWKDLAEASVVEAHAEDGLEKWKENQKASPSSLTSSFCQPSSSPVHPPFCTLVPTSPFPHPLLQQNRRKIQVFRQDWES